MDPRAPRTCVTRSLVAVLAAACLWASPAAAQRVPAQFENAVRLLGDSELLTREQASLALREDARVSVGMVFDRLERGNLSAEQRFRLMQIAWRKFTDPNKRAAMGISFEQVQVGGGPVISQTYPVFPSSSVLRAGDRVVEADGNKVADLEELKPYIICRDPGDVLPIVVMRGAERLEIDCPLGSFEMFENQRANVNQREFIQAWRERLRLEGIDSRGLVEGDPIDARMDKAPVFAPPAPAAPAPDEGAAREDTAVSRPASARTPVTPAGGDAIGPATFGAGSDIFVRKRGESDEAYRDRLLAERQRVTAERGRLQATERSMLETLQLRLTRSADETRRVREDLDEIRGQITRLLRLDEELNRLLDQMGAGDED